MYTDTQLSGLFFKLDELNSIFHKALRKIKRIIAKEWIKQEKKERPASFYN